MRLCMMPFSIFVSCLGITDLVYLKNQWEGWDLDRNKIIKHPRRPSVVEVPPLRSPVYKISCVRTQPRRSHSHIGLIYDVCSEFSAVYTDAINWQY